MWAGLDWMGSFLDFVALGCGGVISTCRMDGWKEIGYHNNTEVHTAIGSFGYSMVNERYGPFPQAREKPTPYRPIFQLEIVVTTTQYAPHHTSNPSPNKNKIGALYSSACEIRPSILPSTHCFLTSGLASAPAVRAVEM